ncbi:RNA-binding domain-containing protein [Flavobacterium psychrophilum]|nr:RNA-binding domain-containing protein [Flavobacterium psychrophilum]
MNLTELKQTSLLTIENLKNFGIFPKENNLYDYKLELNFFGLTDVTEIFLRNFAKDILSFSNGNSGIILLGILEDEKTGDLNDIGLDAKNLELLNKLDLNLVSQKFEKIAKVCVSLDLQSFQSGTRKFYCLLIEKQNQVIIPINDFPDYKLKKGDIIHRLSSKNVIANSSTQDFNQFLQIKANEKNKEFMEIWSKLLPEMFDINPREVLIINPKNNKVYGFNGKDNILSSSDIEIDKSESGIFNIILSAISAGEIGKISDDEGKPLYKIVGEIKSLSSRDFITLSTLQTETLKRVNYKFTNVQLKTTMKHLGWVNNENFKVENPPENTLNPKHNNFIWVESLDTIKHVNKVVFSEEAIEKMVEIIDNQTLHKTIYKRNLELKKHYIT